jgi:hypothetical protein
MFIRHTEQFVATFNEESLIEVIRKHLFNEYYDLRYSNFEIKDFAITFNEADKPEVYVKFEKVIKVTEEEKDSKSKSE